MLFLNLVLLEKMEDKGEKRSHRHYFEIACKRSISDKTYSVI